MDSGRGAVLQVNMPSPAKAQLLPGFHPGQIGVLAGKSMEEVLVFGLQCGVAWSVGARHPLGSDWRLPIGVRVQMQVSPQLLELTKVWFPRVQKKAAPELASRVGDLFQFQKSTAHPNQFEVPRGTHVVILDGDELRRIHGTGNNACKWLRERLPAGTAALLLCSGVHEAAGLGMSYVPDGGWLGGEGGDWVATLTVPTPDELFEAAIGRERIQDHDAVCLCVHQKRDGIQSLPSIIERNPEGEFELVME